MDRVKEYSVVPFDGLLYGVELHVVTRDFRVEHVDRDVGEPFEQDATGDLQVFNLRRLLFGRISESRRSAVGAAIAMGNEHEFFDVVEPDRHPLDRVKEDAPCRLVGQRFRTAREDVLVKGIEAQFLRDELLVLRPEPWVQAVDSRRGNVVEVFEWVLLHIPSSS